jgi:pilus assembly protein CpaC
MEASDFACGYCLQSYRSLSYKSTLNRAWPALCLAPGMQIKNWIFLVLVFTSSLASAADALPLAIGEQRSFPIEPGLRFSVGNPEVIQVKATQLEGGKSLLLVKGKSQGYSDLVLIGEKAIQKNLAFRVFTKKQAAIAQDGKTAFARGSGLALEPRGDGWILRGKTQSVSDWNVAQAMASQAKGKVENLAFLHPLERLRAESRIRRLLRGAGLAEVEVRSAGNMVVLSGFAGSAQEKELAEALGRQVIRNLRSDISVPIEKGSRLRFHARIMEILRSEGQAIGLNWNDVIPSALTVTKALTKVNFSLEASLKLLEREGHARILSQPELLLNEKGTAELKVGGEIPISSHSKNYAGVQWKPYGLTLRLELPGVSRDLARAKITVEISSLDMATASEGIPGLRLSRMETQVDMQLGKPILLSGLTEKRENNAAAGLPFLGRIPILGELFKSRDYQENRSELVILLEAAR